MTTKTMPTLVVCLGGLNLHCITDVLDEELAQAVAQATPATELLNRQFLSRSMPGRAANRVADHIRGQSYLNENSWMILTLPLKKTSISDKSWNGHIGFGQTK